MFARRSAIAVCVSIAWVGTTWGESPSKEDVAAWIGELGAGDFSQRETAGRKLRAVGETALPALRRAADGSDDPEIRYRAERLVRQVTQDACISNGTSMKFSLIRAGTFTMGSPEDEATRREDERQHRVAIRQPFLLGVYEVTQAEYRQVMRAEPSWFRAGGQGRAKIGDRPTGRFPVESVTWFDALEFCNRLSKLDGLPPYYQIKSAQHDGDRIVDAEVSVLGGLGYRLPTEAEWEYACRAGGSGPYHPLEDKKGLEANFQDQRAVLYG